MSISTRRIDDADPALIELRLSDNGPGIPADQSDRIFEPYVTSKTKGTGLGLAIVKRIIEELGGSIRLDTSYHDGASFILQLPLAPETLKSER
jgi:signal transduction histidine kinase